MRTARLLINENVRDGAKRLAWIFSVVKLRRAHRRRQYVSHRGITVAYGTRYKEKELLVQVFSGGLTPAT